MANNPPLLASTTPSAVVPANAYICHGQLRDLVICPRERGILNYVQEHAIIEHNIASNESRILAPTSFPSNTLAALPLNSHDTLLAAGGQQAEIHLSCHTNSGHHSKGSSRSKCLWQMEQRLPGSINNSVFLTSLSLTRSNQSAVEPRLGVSNNDCTVRLYEVPVRTQNENRYLIPIGCLRLDVPINHSSISPDGRTLLSVGDSSKIYFHHMHGTDPVQFEHIQSLFLPPPDASLYPSSIVASFSTAFSHDGMKFAVASQAGVLAVWDIRNTKPMKVIQTDKRRGISDDSYLSDDPTDWMRRRSKAPGFSVRSVKFGGSGGNGKEVMIFTEHTSLLHVVDARTFETEEILIVPPVQALLNSRNNNNREYREEEEEEEEGRGPSEDRNTPPRSTSPVPSQNTTPQDRHTPSQRHRTRQEIRPLATEIPYSDDLDIAGTCFDPSGGHIYVATKESLVEWTLGDAGKR